MSAKICVQDHRKNNDSPVDELGSESGATIIDGG
jgi:hypothetical protein